MMTKPTDTAPLDDDLSAIDAAIAAAHEVQHLAEGMLTAHEVRRLLRMMALAAFIVGVAAGATLFLVIGRAG